VISSSGPWSLEFVSIEASPSVPIEEDDECSRFDEGSTDDPDGDLLAGKLPSEWTDDSEADGDESSLFGSVGTSSDRVGSVE